MQEEKGLILSNKRIAKDTYRMEIQASIAKDMKPGQFVNVAVEGFMLRRPISICSVEDKTRFVIIYKVVGDGTAKLSTLRTQGIIDVFGPLGSSYPIHEEEHEVLLIGGGVGVPPQYELAKQYRNINASVNVVLGFNDQESVFYENEFQRLGCHVAVATMDGSYGTKGTVMDAIREHNITTEFTCSCGPRPMLKAVEAHYTRGYMSFESRMACGIGACMACVAKDKLEENDIRIPLNENSNDVTAFLAKQAVKATANIKMRAIITDSYSGRTARNLAAFRGKYPVLAICYKEKTMRHLALSYGVEAIYMPELANGQEYYFAALRRLLKEGRLQPADMVGYLSSGKAGTQTSFLEINVVEDALKHAEETVLPNKNRYL